MNFLPQGTAAVKLKVAFSCLKRKYKKEIEIGNVFCSMRHDYASHIYVTILWIFRTVCKCLGAFCEKNRCYVKHLLLLLFVIKQVLFSSSELFFLQLISKQL